VLVEDRDGMAHLAELVGARQAGRPAADHGDLLAGRHLGRLVRELVRVRVVAEEVLDRVDADVVLDLVAVAAGFARRRADARPITDGNGFASVSRRHAYSCHGIDGLPSAPIGGFSMPRTMLR